VGGAGPAIVEEARALKAAAIVMPLRYRGGAPLYGRALQTVLAKRPCRVIVSADPAESSDGAPARRPIGSITT
jgi:basic amino acid/polyamine antiporter, APA family